MKSNSRENGQALILIAFAAVALFALAALAIDGSRVFSDRRHAQNAADTAVLAAALTDIRTGNFTNAETEAKKRAASNGYVENGSTVLVDVDRCDNTSDINPATGAVIPDTPCKGVSGSASEYIRVRITSTIPTTFARVIGRQAVTSAVEAVARTQGSSSTGSFPNDAVVALDTDPGRCAICANGNGGLEVHGGGVFSNSPAANCTAGNKKSSITLWTNFDPYSEKGFNIASPGQLCLSGTTMLAPGSGGYQAVSAINPQYNVSAPTISCTGPVFPDPLGSPETSGNPNTTGATLHAGTHTAKVTLSSGTWTIEAGAHCFQNGLTINANAVTANDVQFLVQADQLRLAGKDFTCSNLLVLVDGGSGLYFGGTGNTTCTGVTFYMKTGDVDEAGSTNLTLKAPTGGPYQGLLIYLPPGNTLSVRIGGTADVEFVGSVIAPGSEITLMGTSSSNGFDTQFVGKRILLDGTSNTVIKYNPANQFNPPDAPAIQLTE